MMVPSSWLLHVDSAPHFVENILAVGSYAVAGNKKNNLLHIVRQKTGRLLCGRLLSDSFSVGSEADAGNGKFCRTCKTCALTASLLFLWGSEPMANLSGPQLQLMANLSGPQLLGSVWY